MIRFVKYLPISLGVGLREGVFVSVSSEGSRVAASCNCGGVCQCPDAVRSLADLSWAGLDVAGVEAAVEHVAAVRGWVSSVEARLLIKADLLAQDGKGAGARGTARKHGKRSSRGAQKSADRAGAVNANPSLGDDLNNGNISEEHLDALASAGKDLDDKERNQLFNDPELGDAARRMPVEPFSKLARQKAAQRAKDEGESKLAAQKRATNLRVWVNKDGMHVVNGQFDPETGSKLFRAIDAETDTLAQRGGLPLNDHTRAHALASLIHRGVGAGPNTAPPEILVIDAATLTTGLHAHSVSETSSGAALPPETIRRAMCNCTINHVLLSGLDGQVLNAGRQNRVATRAQRRALRAMYASCAFDNCTASFDHCQIHHITPWEQLGPTNLANLIPLCSHHHHLVHEGRWRLDLRLDRTLIITQPDGQHYKTIPLASKHLAQHLTKTSRPKKARNKPPERKPGGSKPTGVSPAATAPDRGRSISKPNPTASRDHLERRVR